MEYPFEPASAHRGFAQDIRADFRTVRAFHLYHRTPLALFRGTGSTANPSGVGRYGLRLTKFTDYSVRVLMYAALHGDRLVTIEETAAANDISRAHVKKVVLMLSQQGYLQGHRGRKGGFTLARPPADINLGALIRQTEPDFALVECMGRENGCMLTPYCRLPPLMKTALAAFIKVFDERSLADAIAGKIAL